MDCPTKLARQNYSFPSYNGNVLTGLASFDYESARGWLEPRPYVPIDRMKLTVSSKRLPLVRLMTAGCSRILSRPTSKGWNIGL